MIVKNFEEYLRFFSDKDDLVQIPNKQFPRQPFVIPLKKLVEVVANHAFGCSRLNSELQKQHTVQQRKNEPDQKTKSDFTF